MFCISLKKEVRNGQVVSVKADGVQSTNVDGLAYSTELGFLDTAYLTRTYEQLAKAINILKIQFLAQKLCLMTNIDCGGKRCVSWAHNQNA